MSSLFKHAGDRADLIHHEINSAFEDWDEGRIGLTQLIERYDNAVVEWLEVRRILARYYSNMALPKELTKETA